ncbi:MAG: hypothetical protein OXI92_09980 [Acidobacteriota bacterium]|nr:hypothetical protein [Acidobacteriota bacterium]
MPRELPRITVIRRTGTEPFIGTEHLRLKHFWEWSASDLVSNATRGILAEFLVAAAIGQSDGVRSEWDAYDLQTASGLKLEVKSSAYLQSWYQRVFSKITFSIRPTRAWNAQTNQYDSEAQRQADVYVFALLHHKEQDTVNALDLSQWTFYVVSRQRLECARPNRKSIALGQLLKIGPRVSTFHELPAVIEREGHS